MTERTEHLSTFAETLWIRSATATNYGEIHLRIPCDGQPRMASPARIHEGWRMMDAGAAGAGNGNVRLCLDGE